MNDGTKQISYLDLVRLSRAINAGIRAVISNQDYLNKINVFPVPDGDTGTNMALTLNAILDGTYNRKHASIHDYLDLVSECALNGARGNSGTILAQFFMGFSEGAKAVNRHFTTKNFVAAIATASNMAHKALSEPKEGTILTVIRDYSDEITHQQLSNPEHDFASLLEAGLKRTQASLDNTTNQLIELKRAGVVDAGAQGFVNFLQGIFDFIQTGSINELQEPVQTQAVPSTVESHGEINEEFRFCTECIIKGQNMDLNTLRHELNELGNCVIVAGSNKLIKVHIHTNDPQKIFDAAQQHGSIHREKADDMLKQQHTIMHVDQHVAILTDSSADFPDNQTSELNIHVVPLSVTLDGKHYLDKVGISPEEFYALLNTTDSFPTTSQPSLGDFKRQYQFLASHYASVIAIHLPRGVSGTISASETAAKNIDGQITVVDGLTMSAGLGMITSAAATAAAKGYKHDKVLDIIEQAKTKTQNFMIVNNIDYAVRGGRISKNKKIILGLLRLKPIISFDNRGKGKLIGVTRIKKNIVKKILIQLKKKIDRNKQYKIQIIHTQAPTEANKLQKCIEQEFDNLISVETIICSAILGAHGGPNNLGVVYQEEIEF